MQVDEWKLDDEEPEQHEYDYDFVVIGGGSGGLAAAKEAARLGKKVALLDYVRPTPQGTTWGLGGTCVNVGCIPKKLMHTAALHGEHLSDARAFGWDIPAGKAAPKHNWKKMVNGIQDHIASLNWGYESALMEKNVTYINAYGKFLDAHTVECKNKWDEVTTLTARRFLIAIGGRPKYPDIPGAEEFCITSDDLFSLSAPPGKTLCVGASYVSLECAGFLAGLGLDTTVFVRSIFLRGFDQQMADMVGAYMKDHNVNIRQPCVPTAVEKLESGKLKVSFDHDGKAGEEEFDTVLLAVGRDPECSRIDIDKAGVEVNKWGKIETVYERTNVPHIYAVGDIIVDSPSRKQLELTPVAIQAGVLLAQRLYGGSTVPMDYVNVPTTVFTPLEYGACGFTEEEATELFGEDAIEVYHNYYQPLEWTVPFRENNVCYVKVICSIKEDEKIIGFHVIGPNAGEITQGFAVAMKAGATKATLASTIGIHPTTAEEVVNLSITKRSGVELQAQGC